MLRRYEGSYISASLVTTSNTRANGVYSLSHQMQAVRANNWPIGFPTTADVYNGLINNFSGTKYFISPTGSDTNAGTSEGSPLQTYAQFRTLTSANASSIMCVFLPGTYTLSSISASGTGESCFSDDNAQRTFVCKSPSETVFNWTANLGRRDAAPFWFRNANTKFYGGVVRRNNNGRTLNYSNAFFNGTTIAFVGQVYNTVIAETNANNLWALSYNNGTWATTQGVFFCTFAVSAAAQSSYSGADTFNGNSCAGNYSVTSATPLFTNYVNAAGTMNATTYFIAGASGVYNGLYRW